MKTSNQFKLPQKLSGLFIPLILACFALSQSAQGVVPPPDGGYPGFTTAEGTKALFSLTAGSANTAVGWYSLFSNAEGSFNTATGAGTLLFNTADQNTAFGAAALLFNTTGSSNTAVGAAALSNNIGFTIETPNGDPGSSNTAVGSSALSSNTSGSINTAIGEAALSSNTTGNTNTAVGGGALFNSTGNGNIALGTGAGFNVMNASNVICIGANGQDVGNSCFIGQIYSNVQPIVGTDPDSVTITSAGRLGRGNVSSRRYKHDIELMDKASELLYAFKPVTFRYNKEYDATQTLAFGLIAEEVAEVYPDLVGRNPNGEPESVRYEQINAMLLNEFLKEHRKVQEQAETIGIVKENSVRQEATIARLEQQIEALTMGLQKVNARLEASKPAPQVVNNP